MVDGKVHLDDGKVLIVDGNVAMDDACCCVGSPCQYCDGDTPASIDLVVSSVTFCGCHVDTPGELSWKWTSDPPVNATHGLSQDGGVPCKFTKRIEFDEGELTIERHDDGACGSLDTTWNVDYIDIIAIYTNATTVSVGITVKFVEDGSTYQLFSGTNTVGAEDDVCAETIVVSNTTTCGAWASGDFAENGTATVTP